MIQDKFCIPRDDAVTTDKIADGSGLFGPSVTDVSISGSGAGGFALGDSTGLGTNGRAGGSGRVILEFVQVHFKNTHTCVFYFITI